MFHFSMTATTVANAHFGFQARVIFHDGTTATSPRVYETEDEASRHAANLVELCRKVSNPIVQQFIDD